MTDHEVDIRLVGFAGFKASERFLRALDDEIWVARWGRSPKLHVHRPTDLCTDETMRRELELPCQATVISAHAGSEGRRMYFSSGGRPNQVLYLDSIGQLGASSMLLIDACWAEELFAQLQNHAMTGTRLVGLKGRDRQIAGHDSVTAIADVLRELCYTSAARLDQEAVGRAVERVNAQIDARNDCLRENEARRPCLTMYEC